MQQGNGNGDGNKDGGQVECDSNEEVNGDGNESGRWWVCYPYF